VQLVAVEYDRARLPGGILDARMLGRPAPEQRHDPLQPPLHPRYVPDLEAAGYALRIREPDWFEHRMLRGPSHSVNLHVFSAGCPETDRMVRFRDHLRSSAADRDLYARTKRELAARKWKYGQQYADAKTAVINEIMARAEAGPSGSAPARGLRVVPAGLEPVQVTLAVGERTVR
jgi:hypothetical protein